LPLAPITAPIGDDDPRERQHPRVAQGEPLGYDPPNLDGITVLVVDDDSDARGVIARILRDGRASVITAASAAEALEILRDAKPALLISDIGMPGEDGYDLIRKVRALPPESCGRIPAVALTAFARSEDRQRALLAGYQLHVAKPVEPSELLTVCASLVGRISIPEADGDAGARIMRMGKKHRTEGDGIGGSSSVKAGVRFSPAAFTSSGAHQL